MRRKCKYRTCRDDEYKTGVLIGFVTDSDGDATGVIEIESGKIIQRFVDYITLEPEEESN